MKPGLLLLVGFVVLAQVPVQAESGGPFFSFQALKNAWGALGQSSPSTQPNPKQVQNPSCQSFEINETRTMNGLNTPYLITREGDHEYVARFNLKYVAVRTADPQTASTLRQRVEKCYRETRYLRAKTGEGLRFELLPEDSRELQPIEIQVHDGLYRDNFLNYESESVCATILHETLHLTGLWDEYSNGYSCRTLGDSIMAHQFEVTLGDLKVPHEEYLKKNAEKTFRPVKDVWCGAASTNVTFRKIPEKNVSVLQINYRGGSMLIGVGGETFSTLYAPDGKERIKPEIFAKDDWVKEFVHPDQSDWDMCWVKYEEGGGAKTGAEVLELAKEEMHQNLPLRPAHFRKILYPNCAKKNETYDLCTKEAYISRPSDSYQCIRDKYPICQNPGWLD